MEQQERLFQGNLGALNPRIPHREAQENFSRVFLFLSPFKNIKFILVFFFGLVFPDSQLLHF